MEQITSLAYLLSTAGTTAVVLLITQYCKEFLPKQLPVRLFVLMLCMAIQLGLTALIAPSVEGYILAIVNSFISAAAAMGTYEATFNKNGNG